VTTWEADLAGTTPPGRTWSRWPGWTGLAWLIIVAVAAYLVFWPSEGKRDRNRVETAGLQLEGRYLVGMGALFPTQKPALLAKAADLDHSDYGRLVSVTLVGELGGEEEARKRVTELDREWADRPPTDSDRYLAGLLARQYQATEGPLSAEERERLRADLGWFGELALLHSPGQEDKRAHLLTGAERTALLGLLGIPMAIILVTVGGILLLALFVRA
jgi:hypothetical protein